MLGTTYFLAACLAVRYARFEGGIALIWIANAILFADLRYRPEPSWLARCLACGFGGVIATWFFGLGPAAALPLGIINIVEALGCAVLMRRVRPMAGHLSSLAEIGTLTLVAGVILPAVTAFPAAVVAHNLAGVPYWPNWMGWFAGHALGTLTVVPFLNLALNGDVSGWAKQARRAEWLEAGCLLLGVVAISAGVFAQERLPLLFLPFAPMMLAVFRLGRLGATASLLLLTIVGTALTLGGEGPINLIRGGAGLKVQFFQFYLVVAMLMALPAAAELKRRKKLYNRLQQSSALYKVIADRTGDIILAVKLDGTIEYASPSLRTIGGYDPREWLGRKALEIVFTEDVGRVADKHAQAVANPDQTFMVEFRAPRASGDLGWFETHGRAIVDEEGRVTGTVNIIREVSSRKARELDLTRAADTDPLTGLANRRSLLAAFEKSVSAAIGQGTPVCLAVFDLDHFKRVNDGFGHDAGDVVIQSFSNALKLAVRASDVVARLGGEEFAALLIGADIEQAHRVCDRVRREFGTERFSFGDKHVLHVTVSAGLTQINEGLTLDDVIKAADMALYRAKDEGRDRLAIAV
ncbi:diguanylate cyclase [Sphingomonas sp. MJ1 (PH-R8)]|uniref:sensor domain-containing diguanylate cyclase n=1 Tax=Sphingomonas sp. MJ1 (PH-R8) TaxID=3112950 RepID=UPI003A882EE0